MMLLCSCSSASKVDAVRSGLIAPVLSVTEDYWERADTATSERFEDPAEVSDAQGRKMLLMRAVQDENGEMVASDVISPVVVAARFRNVAERLGRVDLRFDVTVPAGMVESRWQLRLSPVLRILGEDSSLQPVYITGSGYRRAQLRGYQRYAHFLESLVSDTTVFIRRAQLEIFLKRNIPELYALRADSSYVSDGRFASIYGVSQQQAVQHYTDRFRRRLNSRRMAKRDRMFSRFVKVPMPDGVRLDSVITGDSGAVTYTYVHSMGTRPGLKKAEIFLEGQLYEEDRLLCSLPLGEPLVYYISSIGGLAEDKERFLLQISSRRLRADGACYVEFAPGSAVVDTSIGRNALEMRRISEMLEALLEDEEFDMDSIVVAASCSPEGSLRYNAALSRKRSEAVCRWYSAMTRRDSVVLHFIPHAIPENWEGLLRAVLSDSVLTENEKRCIENLFGEKDPDRRERKLSALPSYRYLRENIYPHLRVVRFGFYMHRRGMIKDTVHTTVPDSVYMNGLRALKEGNYPDAVRLLGPYGDINSAVAYCAMDYNASAMAVLDKLPSSARSEYLRALVFSRRGDGASAVRAYLRACEMEPSYVYRGNLDPEIAELKKLYNITP